MLNLATFSRSLRGDFEFLQCLDASWRSCLRSFRHRAQHLGYSHDTDRGHGELEVYHRTRWAFHQRSALHAALPARDLTLEGRRSLKLLLAANKRLNTAYLLKESFDQLWSYERKRWARRFFENWCAALKWQRLKPYEKFTEMIDRYSQGVAAYCQPENKVSLGFVEGLNNKICVMQTGHRGKWTEGFYLEILGGEGGGIGFCW